MNIVVDETVYDTKDVTQSSTIVVEDTSLHIKVDSEQELTINNDTSKVIKYDEDNWILYNASIQALTKSTIDKLVTSKIALINSGIQKYINEVNNLKEQAITEAKALVANLKTSVDTSIATLTNNNNIRATETSSNASSISGIRSSIVTIDASTKANSSAVSALSSSVNSYDGRITTNASSITDLETSITTPNAKLNGQTTVLNDLQTTYNTVENKLLGLNSKYGITTSLGSDGIKYITGFGINSSISVNSDGSTNKVSDFNVLADTFSLTHPVTQNKVLMNQDGLYFKKADGSTAKYLQFIHTFINHQNESIITLNNLTRVPQVIMGLHTMPTYKASHPDQDQSFTFSVENVQDNIATTGSYSFTPVAKLHLTANTFTEVLTGTFIDTSYNLRVTNSYRVTTELNPTTISYSIGSNKGTGIANQYQKRKCTIQMQRSSDNAVWYSIGSSVTVSFGESLSTQTGSITYNGKIIAGSYIRLRFIYSDDVGTFTTGATGYWDYKTASLSYTSEYIKGTRNSSFDISCDFISGPGYKSDCKYDYQGGSTARGTWCVSGDCTLDSTPGYSSYYWDGGIHQKYSGTEGYSANNVRDSLLQGYTITDFQFSISNKSLAGITIGGGSTASEAPYLFLDYNHTIDIYYNTLSALITTTINAKKWISNSGSTTIKNTATSISLQAVAKAGIELATGTMNIIVVE